MRNGCGLLLTGLLLGASAFGAPARAEERAEDGEVYREAREYFYKRRTLADGTFPRGARQRGLEALRKVPISALHSPGRLSPLQGGMPTQKINNTWQFIGPGPIKDDFANNGAGFYGFGDASTKVSAIAIHPFNASIVLIGSFGGIAKTVDGGQSWTYVSDGLPAQAVSALAFDYGNGNIVYAGTGDPTFAANSFSSLLGVGIYRSTDKGDHWQQFGQAQLGGCVINKIAVEPRSNGSTTNTVVYAAVSGGPTCATPGVWRSPDSGQTWNAVNPPLLSGFGQVWAFEVAMDPLDYSSSAPLYAATNMGLYKTTNGGASWTGPLVVGSPNGTKSRVSAAGSVVIYSNGNGPFNSATYGTGKFGQVFKSVDNGATFTELTSARGFCGGQCWYDQYAQLDWRRIDLSLIYLGGVDPSRSTDGGSTFTDYAPWTGRVGAPIIHSDQHSIDFANQPQSAPYALPGDPKPLYIGNDGGLYKSIDGGQTWINMNANLPGGEFIGISASDDGTVVGGVQDNGSIKKNSGERAWHVIRGGDGGLNKVNSINSLLIYTTYVTTGRTVAADLLQYSFNGGVDQSGITPPAAARVEGGAFYPPIYMDANNSYHILFGAQNVYRSLDAGSSWTRIGGLSALSGNALVQTVTEAPRNSNLIYAATTINANKRFYVTRDANNGAGATWSLSMTGLPSGQDVTGIAVSPEDSNTAYITLSQYGPPGSPLKHLYKTTDAGRNWAAASAGLPDVPFNDIVLHPDFPEVIFAASDVGVFNSFDAGKTWARCDAGMPEGLIISALNYNRNNRLLYAGTYGRGAYTLSVPYHYTPSPQNLRSTEQTATSITWAWDPPVSPYDTLTVAYGLYDPAAPTTLISSTTARALTQSNLLPNRNYSIAVTAANGLIESNNSISASATTLAQPPTGTAVTFAGGGRLSLSWANGRSPANPAGTTYRTQISLDNFASVGWTRSGSETSTTFTDLPTNTTYYARVSALNSAGSPSGSDVTVATWVPAVAPAPLYPAAVNTSSITAAWSARGNSAATVYEIQISEDNFATVLNSARLQGLSYTFNGLTLGSLYYFRARAVSSNASLTAFTALPPAVAHGPQALAPHARPASEGPTFFEVNLSSIAVAWDDATCVGTCYSPLDAVDISTDPVMATINQRLLSILGWARFGGPFGSITPTPLLANATYYFRVHTTSTTPAYNSDFVSLGSTITLVAPPTAPPAPILWSDPETLIIAWGSGTPAGYNHPATVYNVQTSTDPAFSVLAASVFSAPTEAPYAHLEGLISNTTYYTRVSAYGNRNRAWTAFTSLGSAATAAVPPGTVAPTFAAVSTDTLTVHWAAGAGGLLNPPGTIYRSHLYLDDGSMTMSPYSALTTQLSHTFTSLAPNTAYHALVAVYSLKLKALDWDNQLDLGTVVTLANPPSASAPTVYFSSLSFSWNASIGGASSYLVQISTDGFASVNESRNVGSARSLALTSLSADTTYGLRVAGVNSAGVAGAFASLAPVSTRLMPPSPWLSPAPAASDSISFFFGSNGNGPSTRYEVQASTDGFVTIYSTITAAPAGTIAGLPPNRTFALRLRSLGGDGAVSDFVAVPADLPFFTRPAAPAKAPFALIGSHQIAAAWTANGNSADTLYTAQMSTDNFSTINFSSSTANFSVLFGGGGAGSDLSPDTTYYFRVRASSVSQQSDFMALGATVTLPLAPASTAFLPVSSTTVSLTWQPNGNPVSGTRYEVWRALDEEFRSGLAKTMVSAANATLGGLAAETTYWLKVRAVSHSGLFSAFDAALSTRTLPSAPAAPNAPTMAVLGVSSMSVSWTTLANAAGYRVYQASSPASLLGTAAAPPFLYTGLSSNTAYGVIVAGVNGSGEGPASSSATAYTRAAAPTDLTVPADTLFASSATISWASNGNPDDTESDLDLAASASFGAAVSSVVYVPSYQASSLLGCTTYYVRVRNRSHDGTPTVYAGPVSFLTPNTVPASPTGLAAVAEARNRIALSWLPSPTEGITAYNLYYDNGTGTIDFNAPLAVFSSTVTSFTAGPLANGIAYKFAVRSKHRCGLDDGDTVAMTSAVSATVLPAVRARLTNPRSGTRVSAFTTALSLIADTGGASSPVRKVLFQYKPSTSTSWVNMSTANANLPNPAASFPYTMSWNISRQNWGNYDLRAVALDVFDQADPNPPTIMIRLGAHRTGSGRWEYVGALGAVQTDESVYNTISNVVASADTASDGTVREASVQLPAGALSAGDATLTLVPNPAPAVVPTIPADMGTPAGVAMMVSLSGATLASTATVTMSYPDADNDGVIDGTGIKIEDARILSNDGSGGGWKSDITITAIDKDNHNITGLTTHFSFFALVGALAASNLNSVRVYPIPYKPNGSNPDQGKPFASGDANSGIIFDNLPTSASIKIYTLSGRKVADFDGSSSTGKVQWDARNSDGRDVASGGYLAVISSPGNGSVVKKLLIIR